MPRYRVRFRNGDETVVELEDQHFYAYLAGHTHRVACETPEGLEAAVDLGAVVLLVAVDPLGLGAANGPLVARRPGAEAPIEEGTE